MNLKLQLILVSFLLLACAVIFPDCHSFTNSAQYNHRFVNTDEFKKLSRADQVMKCASCHKQEFDNEAKGPHSNAYHMLEEHRTFVNTDKYKCDFYTRRVNRDFKNCAGCHAPKNLWQTMLYDSLNNQDKIVANIINITHPLPPARDGDASKVTSVDCFSCHYDGKKILSLKHISEPDDSVPGKQTTAKIISNNFTCYVCHADVVRTISVDFAIKKTGSVQCINCHQQKDENGAGTHYYFWKHDPADKINPRLGALLNDFHFSIEPGAKTGNITWANNTMPHTMSPGPEIIFKCEVLDKDSNLLGSKIIRLNKKKEFDAEMYDQVEQHNLFGEYGEEVPLNFVPAIYALPVKNSVAASKFRISLIHKAQYWFPDSLGTVTAVKTFSCIK